MNLTDGSIAYIQIKISIGLSPFEVDYLSMFIIEIDRLKRRIDHSLVSIVHRPEIDLIETDELFLSPEFNNDFISIFIG